MLTVLFEFGFGRFLAHESWAELAGNYDVRKGRVWVLVPAFTAVAPAAARALDRWAERPLNPRTRPMQTLGGRHIIESLAGGDRRAPPPRAPPRAGR